MPRPARTTGLERDYTERLLVLVQLVESELGELLAALPWLAASTVATRADAGEGDTVRAIMDKIRERVRRRVSVTELERLGREVAGRVSAHAREQLFRQIRAVVGVDLFVSDARVAPLVDGFVSENVSLVRDIPERLVSDLENTVVRGLRQGASTRQLTDAIQERLGVARKRAKVIARDQIGSLNGQINAARHRAMGVKRFVWRTSGDERVRREHASRDGRVYEYSSPPGGELPGEPINCRCFAEPVISDILEE